MKILFYSDVHISPYNEFSKPTRIGSTVRTNDLVRTSEWISNKILELLPDLVIDGGDFYDSAVSLNPIITRCGYQFVDNIHTSCKALNIELVMNVGNHDILSEGLHALDPYKWVSRVIDKPVVVNGILIVPFSNDLNNVCKIINDHQCDVSVIHQDIFGGMMNGTLINKTGLNIKNITGTIFCGHYHKSQTLKSKNSVLHFIGSAMSNNFGDSPYDSHGLLLYDSCLETIERFTNPHSPRYIKLEIESVDHLNRLHEIEQPTMTYLWLSYNEDIASDVNKMDLSNFRGCRRRLLKSDDLSDELNLSHTSLPNDVFHKYVEQDITKLDKSKILSLGTGLIDRINL